MAGLHVVPRRGSIGEKLSLLQERLDSAFDAFADRCDAAYDALRFALRSPLDYRIVRVVYRAARAAVRWFDDVLFKVEGRDEREYEWVFGVCAVVILAALFYVGVHVGIFLSVQ